MVRARFEGVDKVSGIAARDCGKFWRGHQELDGKLGILLWCIGTVSQVRV